MAGDNVASTPFAYFRYERDDLRPMMPHVHEVLVVALSPSHHMVQLITPFCVVVRGPVVFRGDCFAATLLLVLLFLCAERPSCDRLHCAVTLFDDVCPSPAPVSRNERSTGQSALYPPPLPADIHPHFSYLHFRPRTPILCANASFLYTGDSPAVIPPAETPSLPF